MTVVLPSSESNFFDYQQFGSPINSVFPSPENFVSGIYETYPKDPNPVIERSNIFAFNGTVGRFSGPGIIAQDNLEIFNPYIHYYTNGGNAILIPYVSTYKVSIEFNPYESSIPQ